MCKQLTQSEQMEFSKNGVFHIKCVVIIFQNDQIKIPNPAPTMNMCKFKAGENF